MWHQSGLIDGKCGKKMQAKNYYLASLAGKRYPVKKTLLLHLNSLSSIRQQQPSQNIEVKIHWYHQTDFNEWNAWLNTLIHQHICFTRGPQECHCVNVFHSLVTRGRQEVVLWKWAAAGQKVGAQAASSRAAPAEAARRPAGFDAKCKVWSPARVWLRAYWVWIERSATAQRKLWSFPAKIKCSVLIRLIIFAAKFAVNCSFVLERECWCSQVQKLLGGVSGSGLSPRQCLIGWRGRVGGTTFLGNVHVWLQSFKLVLLEWLCRQTPKHLNNYITVGGEGTVVVVLGVGGVIANISVYCTFMAQYGASQSILAK